MNLTAIGRIGTVKRSGDEWSCYRKEFFLPKLPQRAVVRLHSDGVCGIFLNSSFVEAHMGRLPNRVACFEVTSLLKPGENIVELRLGSSYYQPVGREIFQRRGAWFSYAACQLEYWIDGVRFLVETDEDWICSCQDGVRKTQLFSHVTQAEYDRFWAHAAYWKEPAVPEIPQAVSSVVGQDYVNYIFPEDPYACPIAVIEQTDRSITYDFGRLEAGYVELTYTAQSDAALTMYFDFSENPSDFVPKNRFWWVVCQLSIETPLQHGTHTLQLLHRRATRYLQLMFPDGVSPQSVRIRRSTMPAAARGWFHCPEDLLNRAWEMGKYTLQVNKHQEYESCPRNEMKYFAGDGIIASLIDYYAFGETTLTDASLSIRELHSDSGLRFDPLDKSRDLWDYPCWRIVNTYNHWRYTADTDFLAHYFPDVVGNIQWLTERLGRNHLVYQYPIFEDCFFTTSGGVEYTCSCDRLGEKPYLNALVYQSFQCAAEMARILGDSRAQQWAHTASLIGEAFEKTLWNEDAQAYLDTYDTSYIPQDGNALAVLFGLASPERAQAALQTLRQKNWSDWGSAIASQGMTHTRDGCGTIAPVMCAYEAEARFVAGDSDGALELIRRCWGTMLKKGATTFWEFSPNHPTEQWPIRCHAWSAGCTYLLSAYALGIRPAKPGYEAMDFAPYGGWDTFSGVVPTVKGLVAVNCRTENGRRHYSLAVPEGMEVLPTLPPNADLDIQRYSHCP